VNILYLNHYAGTPALGMEYRPYFLAREWVRLGHRVQVVAADHSHVRARQPRAGDETIDGVSWRWVSTPPYRGNGFASFRNILAFLRALWSDAPRWAAAFRVHAHLASRGLDLGRLHIVPNGIDPAEWERAPAPLDPAVAAALDAARGDGRVVVGYAGSMGEPNALDTLLDAARLLRGEPFAFVLVGDGHLRSRLEARVREERLASVELLPPIPKAQIPAFLARLHIAWIGWQRVPIYRFGIAPNKLMDYMMARCVVLHAVEAGNDPVAEAGCGLTVVPEDGAATADGLRRLAALPAAERRAMGERGRAFVQAHHTYPVLAARFLEALQ